METDTTYNTEQHRSDVMGKAGHVYDETKDKMSQAYDRTAQALSGTYDQAMTYARENPGKTTLIAMGIGVGLGLLLAAGGRRSRIRRFGEPIVNAISDIALEIIRNY